MGGGGGGFLQYMDSCAMTFGIVLFMYILHHACGRYIKLHHAAFLGGSMIALLAVFLVGRVAALALDPFIGAMVLMCAVLFATGFLSMVDVQRKITPYYVAYSMVGIIGYALATHYGKVTGEIAQMPLFYATAIPSLVLLVVLPLMLMSKQGAGIHSLWVPLGTILLCAAGYYMVGTTNQTIAIPEESASPLINTLLAAGYFCLMMGFFLVKNWLAADKADG